MSASFLYVRPAVRTSAQPAGVGQVPVSRIGGAQLMRFNVSEIGKLLLTLHVHISGVLISGTSCSLQSSNEDYSLRLKNVILSRLIA